MSATGREDLLRLIGLGCGWDFHPPLPAVVFRRLRQITATHPSGAHLHLVWTITGGVASGTQWTSAAGEVVEFEPIVPPARENLLLGLLANPEATGQKVQQSVSSAVEAFWSPTPRKLSDRISVSVLEGQPEPERQQLINTMDLLDNQLHALHLRRQQRARRRGWYPPVS